MSDAGKIDDLQSGPAHFGVDPAPLPATLVDAGSLPPTAKPVVPHRSRFRVSLAILGCIAVAAVAIAIAVASNGDTHSGVPDTNWSTWRPSSGGTAGTSQIAQHVGPLYRANETTQLAMVTPLAVKSTSSAGTTTGTGLTVAVSASSGSSTASSATAGELELLGGQTVAYNVCGLGGKNCTLGGTPSASRLLLLRREALELALYTFQYISGTDNVLVVLPPGRTETTKTGGKTKPVTVSVLFLKQQLKQELSEPLSRTLALYPPQLSELTLWSQTQEASLVNEITGEGLFAEQIESQQEGGRLLVLDQLSSQ